MNAYEIMNKQWSCNLTSDIKGNINISSATAYSDLIKATFFSKIKTVFCHFKLTWQIRDQRQNSRVAMDKKTQIGELYQFLDAIAFPELVLTSIMLSPV